LKALEERISYCQKKKNKKLLTMLCILLNLEEI
jgi:hypothetical protein